MRREPAVSPCDVGAVTASHLRKAIGRLPALPEPLALDLATRARLVDAGQLTAHELWAGAQDWDPTADAAFCALVGALPGSFPLGVVRIGVKDTIDVAGWPTRLGLRHYRHHPKRNAAVLDGLDPNLMTGKVATTELTLGVGAGCANPYYSHLDPSTSSTGSAVAVAGFLCDVSLGTDALGCARLPPGACGVVGMRLTHDPRWHAGIYSTSPPLEAPGWITRTISDLRFWCGEGMRSAGVPVPRGLEPVGPAPRCIGVIREALEDGDAHPACRAAVLDTVTVLRDAGYDVREVSLGSLWEARASGWELCARHAWDGYRSVARQLGDLRASTWAALSVGARISDERYEQVLDVIAECPQRAARAFREESVDAWLLPLAPELPLDVPSAQAMESMFPTPGSDGFGGGLGYTPIASVCGLPALTQPVAEAERAPVAMQIIGPRHSEARLLDVAQDIERARPAPAMTASARLDTWRTR